MAFLSPLGSPIRGSAYRNRTANRARGRATGGQWSPVYLAPYAWYDVHAGGTSSTIADKSGNGRADATYGATTAAPQYLPYTGTAYLHLEAAGTGTNSLSCTAPANTASYAAYPLGGGAATTGAASSGAFSFTTAGDWTQLDLLNGSGTVLASFRAVESGQAGYTDVFSVAWTINRGTAGRKSCLVNRRSLALLGANDQILVPTAAIPTLGTSDSASFVIVVRQWGAPTNFGAYFSNKTTSGATANLGFSIISNGTAVQFAANMGDGTNGVSWTGATYTAGTASVVSVVVSARTSAILYRDADTATNPTGTLSSVASATSAASSYIGRQSVGSGFQDFELFAFLTMNRALTSGERALLSAYYQLA